MSEEKTTSEPQSEAKTTSGPQPYRVRLPGFVRDEDVGLGDAIKQVTYAFGIRPCGGCERRAAALNRWFIFTGRSK